MGLALTPTPRLCRWRRWVPVLWAAGATGAALQRAATYDDYNFDGLNNWAQLPFAFPWVLLPVHVTHWIDIWVLMALGYLNAVILHVHLRRICSARHDVNPWLAAPPPPTGPRLPPPSRMPPPPRGPGSAGQR